MLVRRDLDLERVGTQADFPATGSPIQIGTEGRWRNRAFTVIGRIAYAWERGRWNEWHCRTSDERSLWLSDAQLEYAMTERVANVPVPDDPARMRVGQWLEIDGTRFEVATKTQARYVGTEGELPFTSWERQHYLFVDLQNDVGGLATIDTTESPPLVYAGEYVSFADLGLRALREFDGWPAA